MKTRFAVALLASASIFTASQAQAGCLAGAAAGGVAGHLAGHHSVLGAVGGCVVGHQLSKRKAARARLARTHSTTMVPARSM